MIGFVVEMLFEQLENVFSVVGIWFGVIINVMFFVVYFVELVVVDQIGLLFVVQDDGYLLLVSFGEFFVFYCYKFFDVSVEVG